MVPAEAAREQLVMGYGDHDIGRRLSGARTTARPRTLQGHRRLRLPQALTAFGCATTLGRRRAAASGFPMWVRRGVLRYSAENGGFSRRSDFQSPAGRGFSHRPRIDWYSNVSAAV